MNIVDTHYEKIVMALQPYAYTSRLEMSKALGVSESTIAKIRDRTNTNPRRSVMSALTDYLFPVNSVPQGAEEGKTEV